MKRFIMTLVIIGIGVSIAAQEFTLPKDVTLNGQIRLQNAIISDISIPASNPAWPAMKSWLVTTRGVETCGVVVYAHMYGKGVDRDEFLLEALANTKKGVASLLVSGMVPWQKTWTSGADDKSLLNDQLATLVKAVDFLKTQPWVELNHLVFVGHDYGAMFGMLLAARNVGFNSYVFLAPTARWSDWKSYFGSLMDNKAYDAMFADAQPITAIGTSLKTPVLIQFGSNDRFINESLRRELAAKSSKGVTIQLIDGATHDNIQELGQQSRLEFIFTMLNN